MKTNKRILKNWFLLELSKNGLNSPKFQIISSMICFGLIAEVKFLGQVFLINQVGDTLDVELR